MSLNAFIIECHNTLIGKTNRDVQSAKQYLLGRNLLEKSWESHTIGYCDSETDIPDSVRLFGSEKSDDPWDISKFLKGRIIVPVFDEFNNAVGLASRFPSSEDGNTWWNLPHPFQKGNHLFLLNLARKSIFKKNKVYVVEGYMDALILYQAGLDNVVALMGTALTQRKIGLISRYCNQICLCFDVDKNESGQKATNKAIAQLHKFDFCEKLSVIRGLPMGTDPADHVQKFGLQSFLELEAELKNADIKEIVSSFSKKKKKNELQNAR